jgi:alkylation response protein AidB-like acyl-CoA dehydrogenase
MAPLEQETRMNLDFSDDQKLLQKTARDFLEERSPLQVNRDVLEGDAHWNEELWKATAEMGWQGAVIPEEYGGAGFGYLELVLLAEEVGRSIAPIPFSSSVYLATEALLLGGSDAQRKRELARLASGEAVGTLAWAESKGTPGPASLQTTLSGGKLNGTKIAVPDGNVATTAIVVARDDAGATLALADLGGSGVKIEPARSVDPTRSFATVHFSDAPAEPLGDAGKGWELLQRVLDRAAVLQAFEQQGMAQRVFELTQEQTMSRYAFGRPVASFQAIKHRMADMYVNLTLSSSNNYYAAWALDTDADELGVAAATARVQSIVAGDNCTVEMVQLYGGIGYTWEYDCHLFYRRNKFQNALLGGANVWRDKLVQRLAAAQAA